MYLYSNILGTFVFNQNFQIREKVFFKKPELIKIYELLKENKLLETEKDFLKKFKNIKNLREDKDDKALEKVYNALSEFKEEFYENNLYLTKKQIQESVKEDLLVIQCSDSISEINKTANVLSKIEIVSIYVLSQNYDYEIKNLE